MTTARLNLIDMSDYNFGVRAFWWTAVIAGLVITSVAVFSTTRLEPSSDLALLALIGLIIATSARPTRMPGTQVVITPGDIFVFIAAILYGPAAATLVAVVEAFCVSFRQSRRWTSRLGGPSLAAIAICVSAGLFTLSIDWLRANELLTNGTRLVALIVFSIFYFLIHSLLLATHQALKRREALFNTWRKHFLWAGLTYIASAAVAGLVHIAMMQVGVGALFVAIPLIGVIYATSHLYFKRAEEHAKTGELVGRLPVSSDIVVSFDREGRVTHFSESLQGLTGFTSDEISGMDFFSLPHNDKSRLAMIWKHLASGNARSDEEFRLATKTGTIRWCKACWMPLNDESGELVGIQAYLRDITEQKQIQEQLVHSQKIELIGRLSGGIAHDFNNLLTAIIGYGQMALSELSSGTSAHERVKQVLKAGERASSLTKQLLAFSRRQPVQPVVLDLNAVVDDVNRLLRRLIGAEVELTAIFAPGLGHVTVDQSQIEQVIINLAVNARDAMPNGGRLTIQTANCRIEDQNSALKVVPGDYVLLSVSDTGIGMDEETRTHIFEPFYTTKEMGKGIGLGLSTVYGIVKQSGGIISVESEEGNGTTFRIYLPRVDSEAQGFELSESIQRPDSGSETVLIVEDDQTLLDLTTEVLRLAGYHVLKASNSIEAQVICDTQQPPIDLLLIDLVMPKLNGRELADRVLSNHNALKVLFMSGYSEDSPERRDISIGLRPFIQKPFTSQTLLRKIREVLDSSSNSQAARGAH